MRRNQLHSWKSLVAYNKQKVPIKVTEGQTFLKAASLKRLRLLRMMVDGGVDVNFRDVKGHTALMCVILSAEDGENSSSRETVVEYLLRKGADPNIQDFNGQTALIHACLQSRIDITVVQLLVMYRADPLIKDLLNNDVLFYIAKEHSHVKAMLLECCDKEITRDDGVLKHTSSFESDSQDMYTYLFVPDNTNRLSKSFLTLPENTETKWSPKLNRRKPFYCVEELDMQYDNDGETQGVILKCPEFTRKATIVKQNSINDGLPKVQLSNENGETRLLFGLSSNQFELERMKSSLFDWERQLSQEEDVDSIPNYQDIFTQKSIEKKYQLRKQTACVQHKEKTTRMELIFSSTSNYSKINNHSRHQMPFKMNDYSEKRAYSAPSVMLEGNINEHFCIGSHSHRSWYSTSNMQTLLKSTRVN